MNFDNVDIPPELEEEAKACETPEEMLALAKRKGYKLSDADLAAVSGGWGVKDALPNTRSAIAMKSACRRFSPHPERQGVPAVNAATHGPARRLGNGMASLLLGREPL